MLIERKITKQKQMILIAVILIVNGVVGYLAYKNFGPKRRARAGDALLTATSVKISENIAAIETLAQEFDRSLLDSEEFRTLEKYGAWPVEGADTGRTNPFLPVFGP